MRVTIELPERRVTIEELSATQRRVLAMSIREIWAQILRGATADSDAAMDDPSGRNNEVNHRSDCSGGDASANQVSRKKTQSEGSDA